MRRVRAARARRARWSTAADGVDDLDAIAGDEFMLCVLALGQQLAVDLHGVATTRQVQGRDQARGREAVLHAQWLAVEDDFHRGVFYRKWGPSLFLMGPIPIKNREGPHFAAAAPPAPVAAHNPDPGTGDAG